MFLVWNDAKSFQRHLEAMQTFRQSHGAGTKNAMLISDLPITCDTGVPRRDGLMTSLTDGRGRVIIVPIWKIAALPGLQN